MLNSGKASSYLQVLSAALSIIFSLSAAGQTSPVQKAAEPPPVAQPDLAPAQPELALTPQEQSIEIQRQSVERQRSTVRQQVGVQSTPRYVPRPEQANADQLARAVSAPYNPKCTPVPSMVLEGVIQQASKAYSVAPNLIEAVIRQESGGYPCAVSNKGAMGLMQLMPGTAIEMGASDPFDIQQNVKAGTRFLSELLQRYNGDLNRVLGAYNAGPAAVDRVGGPPPFPETLNYIRSVMERIKSPADPKLFAPSVR
jgi:soluble lytic murein transglycosylase-like protein